MNILQRYVLRELIGPVTLSILFFTFVLLVAQIFRLAELLLEARVGWAIFTEFIISIAVSLIFLTIPMAALLGCLTAIGRLTAENELLAMRVGGLSLNKVFWPVFLLAGLGSLFLLWSGFYVTPKVIENMRSKETEVQFRVLTNLEPGRNYGNLAPTGTDIFIYYEKRLPRQAEDSQFTLRMQSVAMRIVSNEENTNLGNRTAPRPVAAPADGEEAPVWVPPTTELSPQETVIFASEGKIVGDLETRMIFLELEDGVIMPLNRAVLDIETQRPIRRESKESSSVIRFQKMTETIAPRREMRRLDQVDPRQLDFRGLLEVTAEEPSGPFLQTTGRRRPTAEWQRYLDARNELYQRFTLPFSLLAFVLIAIPLAVELRPRAKTISFLIAIGLILFYYAMITFAGTLGQANSPFTLPMYLLPNVLIGGIGIFLFWRVQR